MIIKIFRFTSYNVIYISLLLLSSLSTSAQGLDLFNSKLDTRELSPLEYYEFINQDTLGIMVKFRHVNMKISIVKSLDK